MWLINVSPVLAALLHTRSELYDLAGAEAAVGVQAVPDIVVYPCGTVVAVGINGATGGFYSVIGTASIGVDVVVEQRTAIPLGCDLCNSETAVGLRVGVINGYGTGCISEFAKGKAGWLPAR